MSAVRVGIAGIGTIAREYLRLYSQKKLNCNVTALQSRSMENMRRAVQDFALGDVALYTNYAEMLDSGVVDAVIICTPHEMHPDMARQAVTRGIHTLIEKPLGASRSEALALLDSLEQHPEIRSGVLYCKRMNPVFQYVKEQLNAGVVGTLKRASWLITNLYRTDAYHSSASWRGSWAGECGGLLMTQASHQLDLFLWFCGMPESVRAFCTTKGRAIEVENDAVLHMMFVGGATGQFIASSHEFPGSNRLELSGDLGQIIVEDEHRVICRRLSQPESIFSKTNTAMFGKIDFTQEVVDFTEKDHQPQQLDIINDFMDSITSRKAPICPTQEAVHSLAVTNAAYLSSWRDETVSLQFDDAEYLAALHERMQRQ